MKPRRTVSLRGRGWPVMSPCVAVIRLRDQPGFAVGLQGKMRDSGIGAVWPNLANARRRAKYLAEIHSLPVIESI